MDRVHYAILAHVEVTKAWSACKILAATAQSPRFLRGAAAAAAAAVMVTLVVVVVVNPW